MVKILLIVPAICAICIYLSNAIPVQDYAKQNPTATILRYDNYNADLPNSYRFSFDGSDGTSRTENGEFATQDNGEKALDVRGVMRWVSDNGGVYEMSYKAGKYGYRTIIKKVA